MAAIQDITRELVFSLLPPRAPESHKGNYGKVLCPSPSKPSAVGFMEGSFWQCCLKLRFGW